jgi:hypothetical protein
MKKLERIIIIENWNNMLRVWNDDDNNNNNKKGIKFDILITFLKVWGY